MLVRLPVSPPGADRDNDPAEIVDQPAAQHDPAWDRSDLGAVDELVEVACHVRMDRELAEIGRRLDRDDPDVCAPDAPAGGADEADVIARTQIVLGESLAPALVGSAFSVQHLRIKMRFQETGPRAPNGEIAVAARLQSE